MNLLSLLLNGFTSDSSVSALSQNTGTSQKGVSKLLLLAIPLLLKYLTKNASQQDGALSLMNALGQHNNTEPISQQIAGADKEDGLKIVGHILGDDQQNVVNELAQETEMDAQDVTNVLGNISPALLSGLSSVTQGASAQQSGSDFDASGLVNTFGLGGDGGETPDMGDLFGSLMGGGKQESGGFLGGLLGNLFGGNDDDAANDTAANGADLLGSLLSLK